MINAFSLFIKRIDCVERCLEFVDQRVPDVTAGSKAKHGLQLSGQVFIRFSQDGMKLGLG
jgi:hypothetical protein